MADENEIYQDGHKLLRRLRRLCREVMDLDASDQRCKQEALEAFEASRDQLDAGLQTLNRLV